MLWDEEEGREKGRGIGEGKGGEGEAGGVSRFARIWSQISNAHN